MEDYRTGEGNVSEITGVALGWLGHRYARGVDLKRPIIAGSYTGGTGIDCHITIIGADTGGWGLDLSLVADVHAGDLQGYPIIVGTEIDTRGTHGDSSIIHVDIATCKAKDRGMITNPS